MKKQVFIILTALTIGVNAQTFVSDLEGVTKSDYNNTVYNDSSAMVGGFTSGHAFFPTIWYNSTFGGYYSGWVASAFHDSSTAGYTNQYGCIGYNGYNNSNSYAIGTTFSPLTIRLTDSLIGKTVSGLYVNNATYAYKAMKNGDSFARKFGDTTGTGCGCAQGSYPDWFKLTVKRYYGGMLQNDSVEVYLADYRFNNSIQDYILNAWTWINLSSLGNTDSLAFFLHSSDNGSFGMNTPGFFCIDDLTLSMTVGLASYFTEEGVNLFPNPTVDEAEIMFSTKQAGYASVRITDVSGKELFAQGFNAQAGINKVRVDVSAYPAGVYFVSCMDGERVVTKKLIKE